MKQQELANTPIRSYAVSRLTLTNSRNYQSLRLNTQAGILVFTGTNGAGKTNLLEAVSLLVPGRGLRRSKLSELARRENGESTCDWAIAAQVNGPHGQYDVGTGIKSQNTFG